MDKQTVIDEFVNKCLSGNPTKPLEQLSENNEYRITIMSSLGDITLFPDGIVLQAPVTPSINEKYTYGVSKEEFDRLRKIYFDNCARSIFDGNVKEAIYINDDIQILLRNTEVKISVSGISSNYIVEYDGRKEVVNKVQIFTGQFKMVDRNGQCCGFIKDGNIINSNIEIQKQYRIIVMATNVVIENKDNKIWCNIY